MAMVITDQPGIPRMGVIVATCNEWWLLPVHIGRVQYEDDLGFTYFLVELYPQEDMVKVREKMDGEQAKYIIQLVNYASLLPAVWLERPFPYALLTLEGDHLNAAYKFE